MSHYATVATEITDVDALTAALAEVQPNWQGHILHVPSGTHLYGYQGDRRPQRAHVVVRREYVSRSSNDIGFQLGEDGKYRALLSDYDRSIGFGKEWLGKVVQSYAKHVVLKHARLSGLRVSGTEARADGSIRMVLEV